ncbi:MAG: hypothetical protein MUC51_15630 [Anaerolineae bacterium]|jgi:FtsH-binding integral membrane protein|nr:hypothetical protein [Anaerolineae bacterium]
MADNWVTIGLLALTVGILYAAVVHVIQEDDPDHPYTFVLVIAGTLLTLGIGALCVPFQYILWLGGIYVLTGTPQALGAMYRQRLRRRTQAAAQVQTLRETLRGGDR